MQECRIVAKDLACRRGDRVLFRGVSFHLTPGHALLVGGPNGIGKSSLIRIVAGLMRPFGGDVERTGEVGLLNERPSLDEQLTLGNALQFWAGIDGEIDPTIAERLGLVDLLDVPVRFLSTGQRKRAAMARLIGQKAPIWLLDEPLNGLDTQATALVETLAADHCAHGGIALVASHQRFDLGGMKRIELAEFAS